MSYDRAVADEILARLAEGEPLRQILRSDRDRYPSKSAWYQWCEADSELDRRFKAARDEGFDALAEESLEIVDATPERVQTEHGDKVDPGYVAWQKMRAEQRLKLLAKWDPRRYGDKIDLNHGGNLNANLTISFREPDSGSDGD